MPTLLSAPRDYDRVMSNLPLRKIYEVESEILGSLVQTGSPVANDLDFSQEYRREIARAHSELYLVTENAITSGKLSSRAFDWCNKNVVVPVKNYNLLIYKYCLCPD